MIANIHEFNNVSKNFNDKIVANYAIYKIINSPYQRIKHKEIPIYLNNFKDILNEILESKIDYEYSIFSLNILPTYDNKIKGGRISINLANNFNIFSNTNLNKANELFPISNKDVSLMHRFYFVLSSLLLIKNYYQDKMKCNDVYMKFINSIEGVIIQKNIKNIKIVISIDIDFSLSELQYIAKFIKNILYLDDSVTFKFNYHNNMSKSHIIK